jgi:hypothetical protein
MELLEAREVPSAVTWTGGGGSNHNWSDAANWNTSVVPRATDTVTFDGTSANNSAVDAAFGGTVAGISINSGYTGTITLGRSLTVNGAFTQGAGTLDESGNTLTLQGNLTQTAGTFAAERRHHEPGICQHLREPDLHIDRRQSPRRAGHGWYADGKPGLGHNRPDRDRPDADKRKLHRAFGDAHRQ